MLESSSSRPDASTRADAFVNKKANGSFEAIFAWPTNADTGPETLKAPADNDILYVAFR